MLSPSDGTAICASGLFLSRCYCGLSATNAEVCMRIEHDLLGEKAVPDDAYYGVQTARAAENFHISGIPISQYPDMVRALAMVKMAAARANFECKQFGKEILLG